MANKTEDTNAAPRTGADLPNPDAVTLKELGILVKKSLTSEVMTRAYAHELPVLARMYGRDRLTVVSEQDVQVVGFDPEAEYARLMRKYPCKGKEDWLRGAYPLGVQSLEELTGVRSNQRHVDRPDALQEIRPGATVREAA